MIIIKEDRQRILMLVEMDRISIEEQDRLNHLALNVGWQQAKDYAESLEARGATYRYTKDQVDAHLGKKGGLISRFLKDLFS